MSKILPVFLPFASCHYKCIFCDQQAISGVEINSDLLSHAKSQILKWKTYSNAYDEIAYYGGNFAAIDKSIRISLYEEAHKNGIDKIRFSTRPDTINNETLKEIAEYKIHMVELGIQSLDNNVLKHNIRPYTAQEAIEAVDRVSEITNCGVQLMTGMYKQNIYSSIDDAEVLSKKNIKTARIYPTQVLKNTHLFKLYKSGEYVPCNMQETILSAGGMFIHFTANNVKVIRMGLPEDAVESNQVAAGPWHESFGDIIKTFVMLLYMDKGGKIKYSGYKKIGRELFLNNYNEYREPSNSDMEDICRELRGYYLEDSKWFIKSKASEYAGKLKDKANNR